MNALLKSHVLSWVLKTSNDVEVLIVVGNKFNKFGAEVEKEWPP